MPEAPSRRALGSLVDMTSDRVPIGGVAAGAISQHQAQVSALLQQHFGLSSGVHHRANVRCDSLCAVNLSITVSWSVLAACCMPGLHDNGGSFAPPVTHPNSSRLFVPLTASCLLCYEPEYNEANGMYDVDSYRMCLFKASV
jgi:hypothetical protein